jgi:hypothetical protein
MLVAAVIVMTVVVVVIMVKVVVLVLVVVAEPFVFSSAVKKLKNWNIQDDNFACGSVWV